MSLTLVISHYLYLTKKQRYDWFYGRKVETIGVSTPVWIKNNKTSEPGNEIFVKYKLKIAEDNFIVNMAKNEYEIIGNTKPTYRDAVPEEIWEQMTSKERDKWFEESNAYPTLRTLLDLKDGGSRYLAFKQQNKKTLNDKMYQVIHFVEVKDIEDLTSTLL